MHNIQLKSKYSKLRTDESPFQGLPFCATQFPAKPPVLPVVVYFHPIREGEFYQSVAGC
jgi:hypothetical protein